MNTRIFVLFSPQCWHKRLWKSALKGKGIRKYKHLNNDWGAGLLMSRNSGKSAKFTKTCKIPQNSLEILSNTCLYNLFETCPSYRGCLLAVNVQIYLETLSMKQANNVLKLPGIDYFAKTWALAMILQSNQKNHEHSYIRTTLLKLGKIIQ